MRTYSLGLAVLLLLGPASVQGQQLRPAGPPTLLFADATPAVHPVWAPDGARLAFTRASYEGLWQVAADGTGARLLTDAPAAGFGFSWSPDSQFLVARAARYDGLRRFHTVELIGIDGTVRPLTEERSSTPGLPRWAGAHHVVLRSGDAVEVLSVDDDARTVSPTPLVVALPNGGLAAAEPATGALRTLGPFEGERLLNVTPSPDGRRVAFEVLGGGLVVMNLDGTGVVQLGPGSRPTWSPDGRWVAFMVTEDDGHDFTAADLAAARADGSARVALTSTPDRLEMNPSWSPDGGRIAFDDAVDGALYTLPVTE